MTTTIDSKGDMPAARFKYTFTGAILEGLPTRGLLKSEGKYLLKIHIDGKSEEKWSTREIRTKGSMVAWDREGDKRDFECATASILHVVVCKNHSSGKVEELGTARLSLSDWLKATDATPVTATSGNQGKAVIKVKLFITAHTAVSPETDDGASAMDQAVQTAKAGAQAMSSIPGLSIVGGAGDRANALETSAMNTINVWQPLLDNLDWFVKAMDVVSEVHPYAKMAWSVLSAAYKVFDAQQQRDIKLLGLVGKMNDIYAFLREAEQLQDIIEHPGQDTLRERALCRLGSQTVDCAHFISAYSRDATFLERLVKQTISGAGDTIDQYSKSFDALKQDFRDGSQLRMEVVTVRILADLQGLVSDFDIQHIPYVDGAGYEIGKRCLPGTRAALLDEICEWVNSDSPDTPRVCVLMGPAGTGKSTIAHTISSLFSTTNQLGSMFCFSTSEFTTRKPESLFRNIAHDLCKGRPAFKAALSKSIGGDRSLCGTKDLETQFQNFILRPAHDLSLSGTMLLIVDALDESGSVKERAKVLNVLITRLRELPATFRILITCRPEHDIQRSLLKAHEWVKVKSMPSPDEDPALSKDILQYIRQRLSNEIDAGPGSLDDLCCNTLCSRAEGLFQFAFVACDYIIGDDVIGQTSYMRYQILLSGTETSASLDELYKTVLGQILGKNLAVLGAFKIIMGLVLNAREPLAMVSIRTMMTILQAQDNVDPDRILPYFGSLLSGVSEATTPVRPLHSSFVELLRDTARGGTYFIGHDGHHERLATASLRLLQSELHFNMGDMNTSYLSNKVLRDSPNFRNKVSEALVYSCKYWGHHLELSPVALSTTKEIADLVRHLLMENILFWIETASIADAVSALAPCLMAALSHLQSIGEDLWNMARDGLRFIRTFSRIIIDSAPHIYLSALVCSPSQSQMARVYGSRYPQRAAVASHGVSQWSSVDTVITGHTASVMSSVFSRDSRRVISGSDDGSVRIWNADTGEPIGEPLNGHGRWGVTSVAISPDGHTLVSGSLDKTVILWDPAAPITLNGHTEVVNSVAFAPDGQRFASGSQDKTIRLWKLSKGAVSSEIFTGHSDGVTSIVFSPDGQRIVSGSLDRTIRQWNVETGQPIAEPLRGHSDWVTSVVFFPDGSRIASGSTDNTIRLWDAHTGENVGIPLTGHINWVTSVSISPDGRWLASASHDTIWLWDIQTYAHVGEPLIGHSRSVTSVAFSPYGGRIVSSAMDNTIRIWDVSIHASTPAPLTGHIFAVTSVMFSSDDRQIISGSFDGTIRRWDATTGDHVREPLVEDSNQVASLALSPDGRWIVAGTMNNTIRIWNAASNLPREEALGLHTGPVISIAFSSDSRWFVSGSVDKTIRLWYPDTAACFGEVLIGHSDAVSSVAVSPDNQQIISGSLDGTIRRWSVARQHAIGDPLMGPGGPVFCVSFSPDNSRIVSCHVDKSITIWNANTGEIIGKPLVGHTEPAVSLAFTPDGSRIVSGSADKTIRVWDVATGTGLGDPLLGHTDIVRSVKVSHDGLRIVSGSDDKTIRIWNANSRGHAVPETATAEKNETTSSSALPEQTGSDTPDLVDAGQLCFSPKPQHQLTQPYTTESGSIGQISFDLETGWIMGNGTDYILWVGPDQISRLYTGECQVVIPGPTIHLDLSKFVHGTRWAECRLPSS